MIKLSNNLKQIFEYAHSAGYKIYLVGGFVRDTLLNIPTNDYDLATNMPFEKIQTIIPNCLILDNKGSSFFSIKIGFNKEIFEITHFRIEGPYKKLGYPSKMEKTNDIYQDLKRRDFTINAIAYSPYEDFIDPFEGRFDLKNKLIKAIKNPFESYQEDPTRILRAFRFSWKLDFNINEEDLKAIKEKKYLLKEISKNQLEKELRKFSLPEIERLKKLGII